MNSTEAIRRRMRHLAHAALFTMTATAAASAQTVIYVDDDATPGGDGTSWGTAHDHLQDALAVAAMTAPPVEIRVAQGVYLPDRNSVTPLGSGLRAATFSLVIGTALRGGYAGPGAFDPDARDPLGTPSILDGDLLQDDLPGFVNRAENAFNVVTGSFMDGTAVLDGFTVRHGNADGASSPLNQRRGAGMWNESGSPTIVDCVFEDNRALGFGGAMYNVGGSSPSLDNCMFLYNLAEGGAGGMYNAGGGDSPTLVGCRFEGNVTTGLTGSGAGGALFNTDGRVLVQECVFDSNQALVAGAVEQLGGSPEFIDCIFTNNASTSGSGGAMLNGFGFTGGTTATLSGCSFSGNASATHGGAVYNAQGGSLVTYEDCSFTDNTAVELGGAVYNSSSSATFSGCSFEGNSVPLNGGAMYNSSSSPLIQGCTFTSNQCTITSGLPVPAGGAIFNSGGSPVIKDSIFTGNQSGNGGGVYGSSPTISGCTFVANDGYNLGGAISFGGGAPHVADCSFVDNTSGSGGAIANSSGATGTYERCLFRGNSGSFGGAIYARDGTTTIDRCRFLANVGTSGGAVASRQFAAGLTISNSIFVGNRATRGAGAYLTILSSVSDCTLAYNVATTSGGGVYLTDNGDVSIENSILWGNTRGVTPNQISLSGALPLDVAYSCVEGGWSGSGNLSLDPSFKATPSAGADLVWGTSDDFFGKLRLRPDSPCIDSGNNLMVPFGRVHDLAGLARFLDETNVPDTGVGTAPIVDMGAFEMPTSWDVTPLDPPLGRGLRH